MSVLIWIQTVWHSDSVPGRFFEKVHFEKKVSRRQQKQENYPACKELMCSLFFADVEDPEIFEGLLNNEKENFKVLFEKVCYERKCALMRVNLSGLG